MHYALTTKYIMHFFRQMKSPAITATVEGKNKTLYLQVSNLCVFIQSHCNVSLRGVLMKLSKQSFWLVLIRVIVHVVFCFTVCRFNWTEDTAKSVQNTEGWGALFTEDVATLILQMNTLRICWVTLCYEHVFSRAGTGWRARAGSSWCHHTPDHVV